MTVTYFKIAKHHGDNPWDVSKIATDIQWTTDIDFSAGELKFTLLEVNEGFFPANGDAVSFQWDGNKVFYGFIFSIDYKSDETVSITAYDRLRYLKNEDYIVWPVGSSLQRFKTIMGRIGAPYKVVTNNTFKLPAEVSDGKTYFDMLKSSIDSTLTKTGNRYFIRDNYGTIEYLRATAVDKNTYLPTKSNLIIGDKSLLTEFTLSKSIDDAFNAIKLVREDDSNKKRKVTYKTDTGPSVSQWGRLQHVEKADTKLNSSQMETKAKQLLRQYNRETKTLSLSAIGDMSVRAGSRFYISIQDLRDIGIGTREVLATKVTHDFQSNWTMSIDVEVL
ncbi:XkdQ/YqbQ family protein [Weissella soli]|uniref:XkdQ/YqbQ family protein n=1 Tax=Weissella soli TaxID=155866 RepID=UPI003EF5A7EB